MLWRELTEQERRTRGERGDGGDSGGDGGGGGNGGSSGGGGGGGGGGAHRSLHPAWAKYAFSGEGGEAAAFYVNPTSGAVSLSEPSSADAAPRGSILADEMGREMSRDEPR